MLDDDQLLRRRHRDQLRRRLAAEPPSIRVADVQALLDELDEAEAETARAYALGEAAVRDLLSQLREHRTAVGEDMP